ncbi:glycosyl hydrolase family 18 protein [Phytomonospora sp. NPDC050363]|uniref:chitinase n=1 Tax=Phytomonospora sp. NPDC050363 TaxID=3155642 RepID=UPI0033C33E95
MQHRKQRFRLLIAALAVVVTAVTAVLVTTLPAGAANVLTNGGFESGTLGGWACGTGAAVASGQARTGSYALAGSPAGSSNARCEQTVTVTPGTAYTYTAHVKGSYVYIGVNGGGSTWTPGTGTGYAALTLTFTPSTSSVTVYVHGWYGQPTFYADDIALDGPGGPGPTPTASPTASPSPSPTDPPPTGTLPKHTLTGYWHNFVNGSTNLRLRDVSTDYDVVIVAFAEATGQPGGVSFTVDPGLSSALGGYTDAQFRSDVATLRARGVKVLISVGGERGNVAVGDSGAATTFASNIHAIMTSFGFDGVDIDLENGLNPDAMGNALRQIRAKVGANLIITMAPQTIDMQSTGGSYFRLALAIKDILTTVHTQFYNSGTMLGCDNSQAYSQGTVNFIVALACIQLENGLRPDQVALGVPATSSAAGGGYVGPSVVNQAVDCLARGTNCGSFKPPRTYPGLRGVMTWSINWDKHGGEAFSNTVGPHVHALP